METVKIIDKFVTLTPGNGFRIFPFGTIFKNGVKREMTPAFAKLITLPHFRAPIKLGSHDDTTPAGGFITKLEVRDDGLYAIPEWNEAGTKAIQDGAYRFNSPEILWEGGLENPNDGSIISAPMVLGTALLHMPHLGEATALYSIEPIITEEKNMNENVNIPTSLWDKFIAPLLAREPEKVEVVKTVEPEDYTATKLERDELKAKFAEQEAATVRQARVEKFATELKETKADPTLADLLADVPAETAEAVMKQFKALSAQINESALLSEAGTEGQGATTSDDPKAAFNAIVLGIVDSKKINYNAAMEEAKVSHKDLFLAWAKK